MKTRDKLAAAIREVATEERHHRLADRAATGEFDDFGSGYVCPITELVNIAHRYGLQTIARRAANGDFDATKEESDEWAASPEGQAAIGQLSPELREMLGVKLNN